MTKKETINNLIQYTSTSRAPSLATRTGKLTPGLEGHSIKDLAHLGAAWIPSAARRQLVAERA